MVTKSQRDIIKKIKTDKVFMSKLSKSVKKGHDFLVLLNSFDELERDSLAEFVSHVHEHKTVPSRAKIKAKLLSVSAFVIENAPHLFPSKLGGTK